MQVVRLFGRMPIAATTIKRTSCLRLFAGITSGGSALTIAWRHYRVHASSPPKVDTSKIQSIVHEIEGKRILSSPSEKFDWNLFWYYLRPEIWIIACATAVYLFICCLFLQMKKISFCSIDSSRRCLFKCSYSIRTRKFNQRSIEYTHFFFNFIHRF
jgi:hypothetical protein